MLSIIFKGLIVLATVIFMEGVAWFTHKYIMHGVLWVWHRSHHTVHNHLLERNDLFALVFSIPSIVLIVVGYEIPSLYLLKFVGFGILSYGIFYFIFHDIIVHRRIKIKFNTNNKYMKRIMNAHYIHHEIHTKEGAKAFGFLYAPPKFKPEKK